MRSSFIILILFFSAEHSIAKQLVNECQGAITVFKNVNHDTLPQQDITQFYRCTIEEPAKINLKEWISYLEIKLVSESVLLDTIPEGCYEVVVQFVIDTEGKIIHVRIQKDPGYGLGEWMVNIISQYKGRWQPAKRNGRPVKSFQKQPLTFIVEKGEEECKGLLPSEFIL